jgi:hypothetical protein
VTPPEVLRNRGDQGLRGTSSNGFVYLSTYQRSRCAKCEHHLVGSACSYSGSRDPSQPQRPRSKRLADKSERPVWTRASYRARRGTVSGCRSIVSGPSCRRGLSRQARADHCRKSIRNWWRTATQGMRASGSSRCRRRWLCHSRCRRARRHRGLRLRTGQRGPHPAVAERPLLIRGKTLHFARPCRWRNSGL